MITNLLRFVSPLLIPKGSISWQSIKVALDPCGKKKTSYREGPRRVATAQPLRVAIGDVD